MAFAMFAACRHAPSAAASAAGAAMPLMMPCRYDACRYDTSDAAAAAAAAAEWRYDFAMLPRACMPLLLRTRHAAMISSAAADATPMPRCLRCRFFRR